MIAALLTAAALQMDPAAFASACMAGGGAPGRVEAISQRDIVRRLSLASGQAPVTVMITVNSVSPASGRVQVYVDGFAALSIQAGGSVVANGRRLEFMVGQSISFDYCLRLQPG